MSDKNNYKIKFKIKSLLKEGMSKKDSAVLAGISEATFYRWIKEDESFESQVEASVLSFKYTLVKNVVLNSSHDGKLALEVLRRRYPEEWGNNAKNGTDYSSDIKKIEEVVDEIIAAGYAD